ncbi:MAG: DUF6134 family protein [Pseudomonadota bacterium]
MKRFSAFAATLLFAAPVLAAAVLAADDDVGEYTFTVLYDGDPVGHHRFVYAHEGDRIEIQEATEIEVTFATIPVYTFAHEARQLWQNGRVQRIDATTDDNGEAFAITVEDTGAGYVRTVNGRIDTFDDPMAVLAFWNPDTLKHDRFFSAVEDKTFDAEFEYLGTEEVTVGGEPVAAEHYRMVGDEEREVWYDPDGHVAKVAFERFGSDVEYVRDQLTADAPSSDCTAIC